MSANSITDLLSIKLKGKDGQESDGPLDGVELIGLYFSAHWCPPCRSFTPKLINCYNVVNAEKKRWEIVFISFDRTEKDFKAYYSEMPWLTVPFDEKSIQTDLSAKHGVKGIPALILIDPKDGSVITKDAKASVESDTEGSQFPWKP